MVGLGPLSDDHRFWYAQNNSFLPQSSGHQGRRRRLILPHLPWFRITNVSWLGLLLDDGIVLLGKATDSFPAIFVCFYHVGVSTPMIWQRIRVDVRRRRLKGDHFLVNQILDLVLEVDAVFSIMSNTVGMISTSLLQSVESGVDIHGLGPHRVDVSGRG